MKEKPFDKYYKGRGKIQKLNEDLTDVAIEFWRLSGINDRDVLADKLAELEEKIKTWTIKQRIVVGNKYDDAIKKLTKSL